MVVPLVVYFFSPRFQFNMREPFSLVPNGDQLFIGGGNGQIRIFDLNTYKEVGVLSGHKTKVGSLFLDGTTLFSGSEDTTLKMWDVPKLALVNSVDCKENVRTVRKWHDKIVTMIAPDIWLWE